MSYPFYCFLVFFFETFPFFHFADLQWDSYIPPYVFFFIKSDSSVSPSLKVSSFAVVVLGLISLPPAKI